MDKETDGRAPSALELEKVARLYIRAASALDTVRLHAWESMGLTFPQLRILFRVRDEPGMDVRRLAKQMGISPSAVSQQVERLVSRDLLHRRDNLEDRRRVHLELTEHGRETAAEVSRAQRTRIEGLLARLSEDELGQLERLLEHLSEGIETPQPKHLNEGIEAQRRQPQGSPEAR